MRTKYRAGRLSVILVAVAPRNPGSLKRQKELARQQRQREKREERAARKEAAKDRPKPAEGEDPDIAGIVPGPQPRPEEDVAPLPPDESGEA